MSSSLGDESGNNLVRQKLKETPSSDHDEKCVTSQSFSDSERGEC